MPIYEYRCEQCSRRTTKFFKTFAAATQPCCEHCGSRRVERIYSRVSVFRDGGRGDDDGDGDLAGMGDMMEGLESGDPRDLARMARHMSDEMGEDIPGEYEDVLRRMEAGEMPSDEEFGDIDPPDDAAGDEHD